MVEKSIIDALKRVHDQEIGIDIWTLGLVYKIDEKDGKVTIEMTLTTPMCPFGPVLVENAKNELLKVEGITEVEINLVFDPPWEPSAELRAMLGV